MPIYRTPLPAEGDRFVTDAGLETELVFHDGLELPHFSAAPLVDEVASRERLERYYRSFVALAEAHGMGIVLETPTWRISADWAVRMGCDREDRRRINERATALLTGLRDASALPRSRFVVSGNVGPRYDGYAADEAMSAAEAERYHDEQIGDLVVAGVDAISGLTITTSDEALGLAHAANGHEVPVVVSLTVETDGRLPSGEPLGEAIERIDDGASVAYFGINCAHPSHFLPAIPAGAPWTRRIGLLRANASKKSHAELDECEALDEGDPTELASDYRAALAHLPALRVFGGCCGTDLRHVKAICAALPRGDVQGATTDGGTSSDAANGEDRSGARPDIWW